MDIAYKIAYGLIALGILVVVHELGHFLVAKYFKVRVETFSIGMGPGIIKYKKGGTVYQLCALPFGGFCKMAGEEPSDELTGAPDELYSKPPSQRLGIIFAGPLLNYVFGIFLFILVMAIGTERITFSNRILVSDKISIGEIEINSPAGLAGLKNGDKIIKIGGKEISNWQMIIENIVMAGDYKEIIITVKRNNEILEFPIRPIVNPNTGASQIGIIPYMSNKIDNVVTNWPANKMGIKTNDTIIKIDNKIINNFADLRDYISERPGELLTIYVKRNEEILPFKIKTTNVKDKGMIGAFFHSRTETYVSRSKNIFYAIGDGFMEANRKIVQWVYGLRLLFSGKIKVKKAVSGPVGIVHFIGDITEAGGIIGFLYITGFISIMLGLINLLPIPALDGSYMLIFLFEMITRKKLNYKVVQIVQYVGLMLIIGLSLLLVYNYIAKLIKSSGAAPTINALLG